MAKKQKYINRIRYTLVYNHACKLNRHGQGLVQVQMRQGTRRKYISTRTYLRPEQWDGYAVVDEDQQWAMATNYALRQFMRSIEAIELDFIRKGVCPTIAQIVASYEEHITPTAKLAEFGMSVVSQSERAQLTKQNYKTLFNNIAKYCGDVHIGDIDYQWITKYDKWLREQNISHNTRVSRLRMLRALINEAIKRDIIDDNPFDKFKIQQMVSRKGYVTADQLEAIEQYKPKDERHLKVRDAFLLACYTGLRFSDIISLRSEHIRDGWICKVMVKTKLMVEIPYLRLFGGSAARILERWRKVEDLVLNLGGNSQVNKMLREILDEVDNLPLITFHSSRHTFATLLMQRGVEMATVQKLLGHTKITTTQIYCESDRQTLLNDLKIK